MFGLVTMKLFVTHIDECNASPSGSLVISQATAICTDDGTNNNERDEGSSSTAHEQWPAANAVDK